MIEPELKDIYLRCRGICEDLGIPVGKVRDVSFNKRKWTRSLGKCRRADSIYIIEIRRDLVSPGCPPDLLMNTMLHELLHTCPGCMNHGKSWHAYAAMLNGLGFNVQSQTKAEELPEEMHRSAQGAEQVYGTPPHTRQHISSRPQYRYELVCANGHHIYRQKMSKAVKHPELYRCQCGAKLKRVK